MSIVVFCAAFGRSVRSNDEISPAVKAYIDRALSRASRDLVGRRDFALYADGGRIILELTHAWSGTSSAPSAGSNPTAAITDDIRVGNCWSIAGHAGQLGIRLTEMIHPRHVSIDHLPLEIAADIGRAPRTMILWGALDGDDNEGRFRDITHAFNVSLPGVLGRSAPEITYGYTFIPLLAFEYDIRASSHVQTFSLDQYVVDSDLYFGVVVLDILQNWGGESTCLYRVRIHGAAADL